MLNVLPVVVFVGCAGRGPAGSHDGDLPDAFAESIPVGQQETGPPSRRNRMPELSARGSEHAASLAVLHAALQSADYATRLLAVQAFGEATAIDATPWLGYALGDPEHDVRMAAVDSLARITSPRALELLTTVRDDEHEALDIRALSASALLTPKEQR